MTLEDNKWIEACKRGNVDAYERLYKEYAPGLLAVCLRYVKNRSIAEDILHDSFVTIFSKICQLKQNKAIVGWMKSIVVNNALKHLKKNHPSFNIEDVNEIEIKDSGDKNNGQDIKEQILQLDISQEDMCNIINNLPTGFRTVFNLYAFENLKHNEIAKELGISPGTSRSQLVRARKLIQKKLYGLVEDNQNEKSRKKEKAYGASVILLWNKDLTYIDQFAVESLKIYKVSPNSGVNVDAYLPKGPLKTLAYKPTTRTVFSFGKNMLWGSISSVGASSLIIWAMLTFPLKADIAPKEKPRVEQTQDNSLLQNKTYPTSLRSSPKKPQDFEERAQAFSLKKVEAAPVKKTVLVKKTKKIVVRKKVFIKKKIVVR